ncbi:MAG: hypothetical protein ACRC9L_07795 [Brevinema sp.]
MKTKYFAPLLYVATCWLIALFIFGESGIVDTNFKNKEIIRLKTDILRSNTELDQLLLRYNALKEMKEPDQAFLAGVDRKTRDIVVYKFPDYQSTEKVVATQKEGKYLMLQTIFMVIAFIFVGVVSIIGLTIALKRDYRGKK